MRYLFNTEIGGSDKTVGVVCSFDLDSKEIYSVDIDKVIYQGVDISGCLDDEVLEMLAARAELKYLKQVEEMYE
jgi:hypothetical protein